MRPLPHQAEAEAAVLGGIILRGEAALYDALDVLRPGDFYVPAHEVVFAAMRAVAERREPIDPVTLERQLVATGELRIVGGIEGLSHLADRYATSRNIAVHARIVRRLARLRAAVVEARELAEEGAAAPEDPDAWVDQAAERMAAVAAGHEVGPAPIRDVVRESLEGMAAARQGREPLVGTGLRTVDDQLDGGMRPGELVVVGARPSMGKTALLVRMVERAIALGVPTYVASLEMRGRQLVNRLLALMALVDLARIRTGAVDAEREAPRIGEAAERIARAPLVIDDRVRRSSELFARARRFGRRHPLGLVAVDYLGLLEHDGNADNREQAVAAMSRGHKMLAQDLGWPVVLLCQLNREVEHRADKRPVLADLRESGAVEQDADVVLFPFREEHYRLTDQNKGIAEVDVGKQRDGRTGRVRCAFRKELAGFFDLHKGKGET